MSNSSELRISFELEGERFFSVTTTELQTQLTIGRSVNCGCRVPSSDTSVSGHHALLEKTEKGVFICDNGSRNGVFYKRQRINRRKIAPGDVYTMGECKVLVERDVALSEKPVMSFHKLEQLSGAEKGYIWDLSKSTVIVGSDSGADIRIPDLMVSKRHAEFIIKPDDSCWVKDLQSKNGTKVNGLKLTADAQETGRMLKDGDIISVTYVDYKFLDRRVVHVRSHFVRNMIAVLATLSLVVGGWFAYKMVVPNAIKMRLHAEQVAACGLFDQAQALLESARNARGSEEDTARRAELLKKIKLWSETQKSWNEIKTKLTTKTPDYSSINAQVSCLVSVNNENWKWNGISAPAEGHKARILHDLLTSYLVAKECFTATEPSVNRIRSALRNCDVAFKAALTIKESCLINTRHVVEDLIEEIRKTLNEYDLISASLSSFTSIDKCAETVSNLKRIQDASNLRIRVRKEKKLPFSPLIENSILLIGEPLDSLMTSITAFDNNCKHIAQMQFNLFVPDLPLPSTEKCLIHPNLSSRRADLLDKNNNLYEVIRHLKGFSENLQKVGLSLNGELPLVAKKVLDIKRMEKVYACDCFSHPLPGYSESKPTSIFDETVGVYAFYEYLASLDDEFDSTVLSQRFVPLVFQLPDITILAESYLRFIYGDGNKKMAPLLLRIRNSISDRNVNKVLRWADASQRFLDAQKMLVRKLYRKFIADGDKRDGVIAGGIACILQSSSMEFLPDDLKLKVYDSFLLLRKSVGKELLLGKSSTQNGREYLLSIGIPGDSYIKQVWIEKFKVGELK